MDSKLIVIVVFVTLCYGFMGTYVQAQNTTVSSGNATTTTPVTSTNNTNATAATTTSAPQSNNVNATVATTAGATQGNNTNAIATTTVGASQGNNTNAIATTTVGASQGNNTNATATTTVGASQGNNTNATATTTVGATQGNNANATTATTTGATQGNNTNTTEVTVTTLATNFTRADCGSKQLCVSAPSDCDPSKSGTCIFIGSKSTGGNEFEFSVSGDSDGYIAATVANDSNSASGNPTFVCARGNNNAVRFLNAVQNGASLSIKKFTVNPVSSVKGRVNGNKIECVILASLQDSLFRAGTSFALSVSTGTYNATNDALGSPTTAIKTNVVDLTNPNATVTNSVAANSTTNATVAPNSTAFSITHQQSLMLGVPITLSALLFNMLGGN